MQMKETPLRLRNYNGKDYLDRQILFPKRNELCEEVAELYDLF